MLGSASVVYDALAVRGSDSGCIRISVKGSKLTRRDFRAWSILIGSNPAEFILSGTKLGPQGALDFGSELLNDATRMMDLSHNDIRATGASTIADILVNCKDVRFIDVRHNNISADVLAKFVSIEETWSKQQQVDLGGNLSKMSIKYGNGNQMNASLMQRLFGKFMISLGFKPEDLPAVSAEWLWQQTQRDKGLVDRYETYRANNAMGYDDAFVNKYVNTIFPTVTHIEAYCKGGSFKLIRRYLSGKVTKQDYPGMARSARCRVIRVLVRLPETAPLLETVDLRESFVEDAHILHGPPKCVSTLLSMGEHFGDGSPIDVLHLEGNLISDDVKSTLRAQWSAAGKPQTAWRGIFL